MRDKLNIPLILGTNREGRESEKVAKLILKEMEKHPQINTQLFDVGEFALPQSGYGGALKDQFPEYRDAISSADGLVIVTPEYNHGYPGRLKAVLDLLLREYVHKPVGLVGVSSGAWGGVRAVENLIPVLRELGLVVTSSDMYFPKVKDSFNDDGTPVDDGVYERINGFLEELLWMGEVLKWGRENVPSKFDQN